MARRNPAETPLMRQFLEVKADHPDAIVFFRMGDFYEMFFEDAVIAARVLDLTLTSRDKGREDAVPMCGVPHHAGRGYLAKLTEAGHKVAVVEQTEDPKQARGLVRREVVQIVTPGVVIDEEVLEPKRARYLAAVHRAGARFGVAHLDASTGELRATVAPSEDAMLGELARIAPRELLHVDPKAGADTAFATMRARLPSCVFTADAPRGASEVGSLLEGLHIDAPGALAEDDHSAAQAAAAMCIAYARSTQPTGGLPLLRLQLYRIGDAVVLDEAAITNLELFETIMGGGGAGPGGSANERGRRQGSLLSVLDHTVTAPGGRLLRRWLLYPLLEVAPIRRRQDAVEYLVTAQGAREAVRAALDHIHDLERLAGRASLGVATPRDLGQLRSSLVHLPKVTAALAAGERLAGDLPEVLRIDPALLRELAALGAEISAKLVDDPPPTLKDGGVIREGVCQDVDQWRRLTDGGRDEILAIESRERAKTGISTLRVKYNRVFGYYLEISKSQLARVPAEYVRKQTIATGERYVTSELAELESKILAAQESLLGRELELFRELVASVATRTGQLLTCGGQVAAIDVCAGMAELAQLSGWVRPVVDDGEALEIVEGRHPVVERMVGSGGFVPNDCALDPARRQMLLITGPNMAGKSTYMRQVAHLVLLAQMGSFVPARSATVGVVDRIFTRVGAADNLARGESTFMVEMRETAAILAGATRRSLVVLDEVGRGTSTYDGLSIAWAVAEYLHDAVGCRTLFATHYHELTALAESRPRVVNVQAAAREVQGRIVFLRQIIPGGASRSYGIEVARLAGLPKGVLARAREVLGDLDAGRQLAKSPQLGLFATAGDAANAPVPIAGSASASASGSASAGSASGSGSASASGSGSGSGSEIDPLRERLLAIDPNHLTPLAALQLLDELCRSVRA